MPSLDDVQSFLTQYAFNTPLSDFVVDQIHEHFTDMHWELSHPNMVKVAHSFGRISPEFVVGIATAELPYSWNLMPEVLSSMRSDVWNVTQLDKLYEAMFDNVSTMDQALLMARCIGNDIYAAYTLARLNINDWTQRFEPFWRHASNKEKATMTYAFCPGVKRGYLPIASCSDIIQKSLSRMPLKYEDEVIAAMKMIDEHPTLRGPITVAIVQNVQTTKEQYGLEYAQNYWKQLDPATSDWIRCAAYVNTPTPVLGFPIHKHVQSLREFAQVTWPVEWPQFQSRWDVLVTLYGNPPLDDTSFLAEALIASSINTTIHLPDLLPDLTM